MCAIAVVKGAPGNSFLRDVAGVAIFLFFVVVLLLFFVVLLLLFFFSFVVVALFFFEVFLFLLLSLCLLYTTVSALPSRSTKGSVRRMLFGIIVTIVLAR